MASVVGEQETIVVRHWRIVSNETDGIVFSANDKNDDDPKGVIVKWLDRFRKSRKDETFRVEQWTQTYTVSPSTWRRVGTRR